MEGNQNFIKGNEEIIINVKITKTDEESQVRRSIKTSEKIYKEEEEAEVN